MDPTTQVAVLTLTAVLTGPGIPVAALVIRQLVEYLRGSLPFLANFNGLLLAFILNALLYLFAWLTVGVKNAEGMFAAVLTWLGCGMATYGAHKMLGEHGTVKPAEGG